MLSIYFPLFLQLLGVACLAIAVAQVLEIILINPP